MALAQLPANIEAQAAGAALGREEGLEQMPLHGFVHGRSVAPHLQADLAGRRIARGHRQRVGLGAHVAQGVVQQVDQHPAQVLGIKKGVRGTPGELEGVVYYGKDNQIGEVSSNTQIGIYGTLTKNFREEKKNESLLCPVGYKQEIQTKDAVILSDASGELQSYRIVIDDLDYTPGDKNKGIRFHVEDENLLKLTGGIVQGLSGSPILQDGKLIGAVTHVLVNDPTKGYGIFVEEMTANKIGQKT